MASTDAAKTKLRKNRGGSGFRRTGALVDRQVKDTSQGRGFLETRLLTHWADVVGDEIAGVCEPVEVTHRQGFGATLVLLTKGATAPILEMQKDSIKDRVNAVYGYCAVTRVRITQTAAHGFGEEGSPFAPAPKVPKSLPSDPKHVAKARESVTGIQSETLRGALEALGASILAQNSRKKGFSDES